MFIFRWNVIIERVEYTDADVEVNDVVLVHVRNSLADLTQPVDALQLSEVFQLDQT